MYGDLASVEPNAITILTSVSTSQDEEGTVTNRLVVSGAQTGSAATSPVSTLVLKVLKSEGTKHTADLKKKRIKKTTTKKHLPFILASEDSVQ